MCNERDRLIAYIYNECDATERDAVRQHLDTCDECRVEVGALRSVREDLLAWDVPVHGSVWQPFAPAKPPVWWRQVPAWALAAAAGLVIFSGAAGGAVAHAYLTEPVQASVVAPRESGSTPVSLTAADLAALEQRLIARFSDQVGAVDARVQLVSNRPIPVSLTEGQASLSQEVVALREANKQLNNIVGLFLRNQRQIEDSMDMKNAAFESRLSNMQANMKEIVSQIMNMK